MENNKMLAWAQVARLHTLQCYAPLTHPPCRCHHSNRHRLLLPLPSFHPPPSIYHTVTYPHIPQPFPLPISLHNPPSCAYGVAGYAASPTSFFPRYSPVIVGAPSRLLLHPPDAGLRPGYYHALTSLVALVPPNTRSIAAARAGTAAPLAPPPFAAATAVHARAVGEDDADLSATTTTERGWGSFSISACADRAKIFAGAVAAHGPPARAVTCGASTWSSAPCTSRSTSETDNSNRTDALQIAYPQTGNQPRRCRPRCPARNGTRPRR